MTVRLIALLAFITACARTDAGLAVSRGFAFRPVTGSAMAAYATIVNRGAAADTLSAIASPEATAAAVHRSMEMEGMVHMEPVGPLAIAPGDSLVLEPGGLHAMLQLSGTAPAVGDSITLVLRFARAGERTARLPVLTYGEMP